MKPLNDPIKWCQDDNKGYLTILPPNFIGLGGRWGYVREEEGMRKRRKQSRNFMSLFYVNQTRCFVLGLRQSLELELSSRNKVKMGCLSPTSYQGWQLITWEYLIELGLEPAIWHFIEMYLLGLRLMAGLKKQYHLITKHFWKLFLSSPLQWENLNTSSSFHL